MLEYKTQIFNGVKVQTIDLSEAIEEWKNPQRKIEYEEKIINGVRVYVADLSKEIERWKNDYPR